MKHGFPRVKASPTLPTEGRALMVWQHVSNLRRSIPVAPQGERIVSDSIGHQPCEQASSARPCCSSMTANLSPLGHTYSNSGDDLVLD